MDDAALKLAKWGFSILLITYFGTMGIYIGFFKLVDCLDNTIFDRYASENQFNKQIYFSEEAEIKTNIISEIMQIKEIDELPEKPIGQAFYKYMNKYIDEVVVIMNDNNDYQNYLQENNTSIENAKKYINRMAYLDDKIVQMSFYLTFLIMCLVTVGVFKYRKSFYIIAGITYLLVIASTFSDGLSDYIVTNAINLLAKLQSGIFTYQNMEDVKLFYIDAFKESMITFIIFDTVIQILEDKKDEKRIYQMRYIYNSINIQIEYFKEQETSNNKYIGKMKFNDTYIIKKCNKNILRLEKIKKKQKRYNKIYDKYVYQLVCWRKLEESITLLASNEKKYCTDEYLTFLEQARDGMVECKLVY